MILVTGATGLVGGHLLWQLLEENKNVVALKRSTSNLENLRKIFISYNAEYQEKWERIIWKTADILDETSLKEAFNNIDIVYHCAAIVSLRNGNEKLLNTNIEGTKNVVSAALKMKVKKLCFVSSIAACGKAQHNEPITENNTWDENAPHSAYARSKYLSEMEVWKGIHSGLDAVIVNPGVIIGFSGNYSGSSELFKLIKSGLKFYTPGGSGYIDVKDVVKIMLLLMNSNIKNERFILTGENCSNKEVLGWIADGFHKIRPFIFIPEGILKMVGGFIEVYSTIFHIQPAFDRSMAVATSRRKFFSNEKIRSATGYQFTPVKSAIEEVCKSIRLFKL